MAKKVNNYNIQGDSMLAMYLKEIAKTETLTLAEEADCAERIKKDDSIALERLVRANLRFVVSVARNYQNQGMPLVDLINEGNLGLIKAAKRYDGNKNFKFISYAVWWIRQSILQALAEQSRIIRLPLNRVGTIHKISKTQVELEQKLMRPPNESEIASELNMKTVDITANINAGASHVSFDSPVQSDQDAALIDIFVDREQEETDYDVVNSSFRDEIIKVLSVLSSREQNIVKLYFGLEYDMPCTLEEIGRQFGLTRERARQIKEKAIKKLRAASSVKRLRELVV